MKAIILAGGYATRLMPLTKHIPKPLLPVAGKPVIDYIIEQLNQVAEIDGIIVSTNKFYEINFKYWLRCLPQNPTKIKMSVIARRQRKINWGPLPHCNLLFNHKNFTIRIY